MHIKLDDKKFLVKIGQVRAAVNQGVQAGLREILDQVGLRAVGDHMISGQGLSVGRGKTVTASSRVGSAADPNRLAVKSGRLARSLSPGGGPEGIRRIVETSEGFRGYMGTRTPYALTHEEGLSVANPISGASIDFPERPFLHPAVRDVAPLAPEILKANIIKNLRKMNRT
ncbi:hypothetical protein ACFLT7_06025 [candidate division KSB1 bacterium]